MEIGIGLDLRLGLTEDEERAIVREAPTLGYTSAWTNAGAGRGALDRCVRWWRAAPELTVGTSVVPMPSWSPTALAEAAVEVGDATSQRFVLGVGSGQVRDLAAMRAWLEALRAALRGRAPIYLAALGPRMLRLAGELADGVALNWCTAEHIAWSRERIAAAGRRVSVIEYIRVAVDEDEDVARRALAGAVAGYAFGPNYGPHFRRMGFDGALRELEARRERGATPDEIVEAFPPELLRRVGYFGTAAGAASAFRRLGAGLDLAIVRVVPARPGVDSVLAALRACRPELVHLS